MVCGLQWLDPNYVYDEEAYLPGGKKEDLVLELAESLVHCIEHNAESIAELKSVPSIP